MELVLKRQSFSCSKKDRIFAAIIIRVLNRKNLSSNWCLISRHGHIHTSGSWIYLLALEFAKLIMLEWRQLPVNSPRLLREDNSEIATFTCFVLYCSLSFLFKSARLSTLVWLMSFCFHIYCVYSAIILHLMYLLTNCRMKLISVKLKEEGKARNQ